MSLLIYNIYNLRLDNIKNILLGMTHEEIYEINPLEYIIVNLARWDSHYTQLPCLSHVTFCSIIPGYKNNKMVELSSILTILIIELLCKQYPKLINKKICDLVIKFNSKEIYDLIYPKL